MDKPPTIHELMDNPLYVSYLRKIPRIPANIAHGNPWMLVSRIVTDDGRNGWTIKYFETYRDMWPVFVSRFKNPRYLDLSLVSRRKFFTPPQHLVWDPSYDWCPRCRRPSTFIEKPKHHALKGIDYRTTEEPFVCYYCGIRWAAIRHSPVDG